MIHQPSEKFKLVTATILARVLGRQPYRNKVCANATVIQLLWLMARAPASTIHQYLLKTMFARFVRLPANARPHSDVTYARRFRIESSD